MRNREVVEQLLAAFRANDRDTIRRLLSPDVQWVQNAGFPGGATHEGPNAVIDGAFARLRADWVDWTATVREVLDAETAVVVLGEYRGTYRATGRSAAAPSPTSTVCTPIACNASSSTPTRGRSSRPRCTPTLRR